MDNLIIQIQNRPTDVEGRVGLKSLYSDKNFVTLQAGIQDRNYHLDLPGLMTNPGLSVAGLTMTWGDFICFAPGGVLCNVPSGSAGLTPADPSIARIDILTVDPAVQHDADGEIEYSGAVGALAGLTIYGTPMMPGCPLTRLKIAEMDIPAGATVASLRDWKPNYVVPPLAKPHAQDTPDMTIRVDSYRGFIGSLNLVSFSGGTCAFSAPAGTGVHRIDLVTLTTSATLHITVGSTVEAPTVPTVPSYPSNELPIAEVQLYGEQDFLSQAEIKDVRPFASTLGAATISWPNVTGKPTSPSLEEMATEHKADGIHKYNKVWTTLSFAYAGDLSVLSNIAPALAAPCDLEINRGYGYVKTAPVGGTIAVDFKVNGSSIFAGITTNMINIPSGQQVDESSAPAITIITKNQVITADIISVPGVTPGSDLTAHLRCIQTVASLP